MKRLVVGIDPSTNLAGFAAFDPDARELLHTALITSEKTASSYSRIKFIADEIAKLLEGVDPDVEVFVYSENTVMRGKGGATFQRCIGAIHSRIPERMHIDEIQNSTVKKIIGGHGQAGKDEVAIGLLKHFPTNAKSRIHIHRIIDDEAWDITDAIAIGIAGFQKYQGR